MSLTYNEAVEQTITAGEQIHQIVNGTATTEVTVEDGSKVPSIRKALLDNFYFKDPIAWQVGQTENVFNQLRQFTDGSWWYAPSATASNPISMGSTPVGDSLWKIYDFDAIGKLTPQIREVLRRSYAEAGYTLVDGSFEAGGTLVNANDVLLQERTSKAFTGPAGQVPAGNDPSSGGFVDASNKYQFVNVMRFGAVGDGVTDDTVALQSAINSSPRVNVYFPAGKTFLVSSLVVGAMYGSSTQIKIIGYGATIKAKTNNSTILRLGSATAILGGSKVEGLEFDLRNVSGCTAIKCYNYRNGSSLESLILRGGVALTNNNIGVHFEELNWYTGMELVSCYGFAKGFWLGSSSNTVNLLSCAADGCDIGVHIQRGTYVTVGVSITNGYYQGCRIGVWDERGWHTSINNAYFESNTEIDVWYDRTMFTHHISSAHLVDSATCIGIKGNGCEGATITGAGFHNSRLREYDWDASNTYCRATPIRTEFFGINLGVTTGLKMYNNWNGTRQIGDIGVLPASGSGKLVGSMGTGTVDQRTVYIGNGFDAVRVDSSASPIRVSDGVRVHYISINANVALTVSGTPISGQSLLLCMRSDNPNLVVTFAGKPIQWFTSGGTKNAVCEVVYIGEGLNQWMIGATWWT